MTTLDKLRQTIADTLKVPLDQVGPTTRDEDLTKWDSLGQVNLIMALEQEFGVYVEVDDFGTLNSVPAIMAFLGKQGIA